MSSTLLSSNEPLFRVADASDLPAALTAYAQIKHHLGETVDYPHWHTADHPAAHQIERWVARGELYLALIGEEITGVVVLNHEAAAGFDDADWAVAASGTEVLVMHALGVVPQAMGRGIGRFLVESSIGVGRAMHCKAVRLDTYVENTPGLALYRRFGFTDLGLHTLRYESTDISQFHLFEYVL